MQNSETETAALLQNDDFIRWAISPDEQSNAYWENWQQQDPVREEMLQNAKKIVLSVYHNERALIDGLDKDITRKAWEEISRHVETRTAKRFLLPGISGWMKYAVAASVIAIAGMIFFRSQRKPVKASIALNAGDIMANASDSEEIQFSNSAELHRLINLPDGSRIVLSKNSSLHYARLFNRNKREVYLTGDAFFDVAKDAKRPFYVYSGNVVTKVLGTSFRIISDDQLGKVTVSVKTGKVKVFRQSDAQHQKDQYLLIRNEQLVFLDKETKPVKASIQDGSVPASEIPASLSFSFDEASLQDILGALTKTYHIDIVFDKAKNEKCRVTVSLDGKSLYDKLDLLCMVTGATYHTEGGKIYMDGKGCN
ncbi:MAG: FecR family protein [Bacteroidota bacterium]|nr:FecR family protein [Bacteroidota bacterium]MDP4213788.1 FecR family protein [Bacteroidota bacterium]